MKKGQKSAQAGVSKMQNLLPTPKDRYVPTQNPPAASRNGKDIPQVASEQCNQAIPAAKNSAATPSNQDALYIMCRSGSSQRKLLPLTCFSVRKIDAALQETLSAAGFNGG
ncbi:hypothetical protein [Alloprevotella tannerae]|uniref:hypothetical protein n=1 Tax=Alloprevotella tannerae TaxID=76122 RepID=UPI0028E3E295|nr:hypothetical protein [Alloprevotella tannerae]